MKMSIGLQMRKARSLRKILSSQFNWPDSLFENEVARSALNGLSTEK